MTVEYMFFDYLMAAWLWVRSQAWTILIVAIGLITASATLYSGSVMSNLVAGLGIRLSRFYRRRDYVTLLDGIQGQVLRVGATHTKLLEPVSRDTIWVGNADIVAGEIINHSLPYGHPLTIHVPVYDYGDTDRLAVLDSLLSTGFQFKYRIGYEPENGHADIFSPVSWLHEISGNAEYYRLRIWIAEAQIGLGEMIAGALLVDACIALEQNGVGVGEVGEVGFGTTRLEVANVPAEEQEPVRVPPEDFAGGWGDGGIGDGDYDRRSGYSRGGH